jgi:hypothetical protein
LELEVKRRWILALITANLIGLGALIFYWPNFMVSPGPLSPAHAALNTDCFGCHVPFHGAAAAQCVSCHTVATIGLLTTTGVKLAPVGEKANFHQQLATQDCLSCHTAHAGSALALGGLPPFSHDLLPPSARANCASCHTPPNTPMHQGVIANCGQCHTQQAWKPANFDHSKFFLLTGPHAATCATCHINNDTSHYTCFGCHEHQPNAISAKHLHEGIQNFQNCAQCHRSARGEYGEGGSGGGRGDD